MDDQWTAWIGRTQTCIDTITPAPLARLAATLDRDEPPPQAGAALPPLAHWLFFLPAYRKSAVGPDGHATRGEFLPPIPLPRRMWAGGRIRFETPLHVGDVAVRRSEITAITEKEGRSGSLAFVVVRHTIGVGTRIALVEEHDIVYRSASSSQARAEGSPRAPVDAAWTHEIDPDPVLLFRYSALTFNSHRIHYDRRYATEVEGYPGLVVHGPLIATLLVDLLRRAMPDAQVSQFAFRAVSPLFDTASFFVRGQPGQDGKHVHLWAANVHGALAMDATATLSTER
jgi:3-methylfumaryl-CoA hydratase